jgi:hypothetical protein
VPFAHSFVHFEQRPPGSFRRFRGGVALGSFVPRWEFARAFFAPMGCSGSFRHRSGGAQRRVRSGRIVNSFV